MRLTDIGSLLPYHSHVDPETVTNALNRMIDDVGGGKVVLYRFYTEAQRREQPARERTGLFYFRGKPGAPFAVICPGGGFSFVGSIHEGFPYASEISRRGFNAFVLRYRAERGAAVATQDLAAALAYIFDNAKGLGVSTSDYSLWGSSAGARMAAAIGSGGAAAYGGSKLPKPAVVVMAYTAHSHHSSDEPPTFVASEMASLLHRSWRGASRRCVDPERTWSTARIRISAMGSDPAPETSAEGWIGDATRFWERFIRKKN